MQMQVEDPWGACIRCTHGQKAIILAGAAVQERERRIAVVVAHQLARSIERPGQVADQLAAGPTDGGDDLAVGRVEVPRRQLLFAEAVAGRAAGSVGSFDQEGGGVSV